MIHRRVVRMVAALFLIALIAAPPGASGQGAGPALADPMPDGVSFQVLATADAPASPAHTDGMRLHRIFVGCGQATGEMQGPEQLTWVEYGQVNVHDWASGSLIATLSAGQAFGPADGSFYLASPAGRSADIWHFSASGAGSIGTSLPPISFETTDCGSGVTQPMETQPATVTTVFEGSATAPAGGSTLYAGVVLMNPGASLGQPYASGEGLTRYVSNGIGIVLPVMGGFGDGSVGMAGIGVPEIAPGQAAALLAGDPVTLENFGVAPTLALIFGALPPGATIASVG